MQGNNLKDQDAAKLNRRKFLTRAGVGLVVASLPAKSVWATSGGFAQSIVASGQGSTFDSGSKIRLCKPSQLLSLYSAKCRDTFYKEFGNKNPFINALKNSDLKKVTFKDIFERRNYGGYNDINISLATIYLNASLCSGDSHGSGIYYPIVGPGKAFSSKLQLAIHLHGLASSDLIQTAAVLNKFINNPNG